MVDWEERYQTGDMPWDKGAPAPPLLEWLEHTPLTGEILVPGCGFGHDVRALAMQPLASPDATAPRVLGLDIAPSAIHVARAFPLAGGESYELGDLFALPRELRGRFDWVFEHTCFCAIDPSLRADYAEAAAGALKPEGCLLAVFYLNPNDPDEEDFGGPPYGVTEAELDELFHPFFTLSEQFRPTRAYPGREGRELLRLLKKRERST
jgi:hypothetical protein